MPGTCFTSNLGARAVQCNPQDVSGTQRYRFFATALTNHKEALVLKRRARKRPQASSSSSSPSISHCSYNEKLKLHSKSRKEKDVNPVSFVNTGSQTDKLRLTKSLVSSSSLTQLIDTVQKQSSNKSPQTPQLTPIELEKLAREKERREQEAALPPVTDKESLEAYRIFLEENERKDFALREKELDEQMKEKLKQIQEDLHDRYKKENEVNLTKIELIRRQKIASLKNKQSQVVKKDRIMEYSNETQHHTTISATRSDGFDAKSHPSKSCKVSTIFPARSKNQIRKAKEDLDLVTAFFERKT